MLAAGFAGWTASALPFFPHGWPLALAAIAGAATALRERTGLAVALAVPVLPLGNVSLGLAAVYAVLAAAWLAVSWRDPRTGLLFALGPLLAPLGALGLVPLAVSGLRSAPRRAAQAALAVLAAVLAAGLRGAPLPLTGEPAPLGVGVEGSGDPLAVAGSLARAAVAHPALLVEACAFAALAVLIPLARPYGRWGAAAVGAAMVLLCIPVAPAVALWPLVAAAWVTAVVLAIHQPSD
jgi:hypothetical protein